MVWEILFLTGTYQDVVDFDFGVETNILTAAGSSDIFVQKLNREYLDLDTYELPESPLIYPNPSSGAVTVDLKDLNATAIKVYSLNGQLIYQDDNINTSIYQFELEAEQGIYLVEISTDDSRYQYKLLKN